MDQSLKTQWVKKSVSKTINLFGIDISSLSLLQVREL